MEDDTSSREVFAEAMEAHGHIVDATADPIEALRAFREHVPDAIWLDWMLPEISADGLVYVLAPLIRARQVRVVICTASEDPVPEELHGVRVAAVARKPFDLWMMPVYLGYKSKAEAQAEWNAVQDYVRGG